MADMYGAVRSNEVKVRDIPAFTTFIQAVSWGDTTPEVWVDQTAGTVSFGCYAQYPSAVPDAKADDYDFDNFQPLELDTWVGQLQRLLQPGQVLHVVGGGYEKLRYVSFTELIVSADEPGYLARTIGSDDPDTIVSARLANPGR